MPPLEEEPEELLEEELDEPPCPRQGLDPELPPEAVRIVQQPSNRTSSGDLRWLMSEISLIYN
jgi:hypothetical protein